MNVYLVMRYDVNGRIDVPYMNVCLVMRYDVNGRINVPYMTVYLVNSPPQNNCVYTVYIHGSGQPYI